MACQVGGRVSQVGVIVPNGKAHGEIVSILGVEPIYQRVGLRFHLSGLNEADTAGYVAHHLQRAGVTQSLFTPSAVKLLATQSRGLPRVINHLAIGALWDAESQNLHVVDEPQMQRAISDWRDDG